jgi:hypothetical protein
VDLTEDSSYVWANDVRIVQYDIIEGTSRAGAYVVYLIRIGKVNGGYMTVIRRYSEISKFRDELVAQYPDRRNEIPQLPPKTMVARFRPQFLEQRRKQLEYFLMCVVLNPAFASSAAVKRFVSDNPPSASK